MWLMVIDLIALRTCNAGDIGSIPTISSTGPGNPTPVLCLEEPMDRGRVSYSPWDQRVRHDSVTKHKHNIRTFPLSQIVLLLTRADL